MKELVSKLSIFYATKSGRLMFGKKQTEKTRIEIDKLIKTQSIFSTFKEIYWAYNNNISEKPTCSVCGGKVNFNNFDNGFYKTCSVKCAARDPARNEKIKQTELKKYGGPHTQNKEFKKRLKEKYPILPGSYGSDEHKKSVQEKYGVDNVFQVAEIKEKIKETNQERYGVDNPLQNDLIKEKVNLTKIERYGQAGWNHVQTKLTMTERYGVDNPLKSDIIREQIKKTCMERYGVKHVMQDPKIFDRCMKNQFKGNYKLKDKIMPSGKIIKYQGYEGYVIQYLLDNEIAEDDLALERTGIPTISYHFEGKDRRYYPDIFIKSKNMLIEVKSTWTFNREVEKNIAKHMASKDAGYHHIIIIWDASKNCIFEIINI